MNDPIRDVKKIAVLRANAVGDFIVTLPALAALRNRYPGAEIVLLGRHWHALFLAARPGPVDRTVVVPYSRGVYDPPDGEEENPGELREFFRTMAEERFDLAFQLHGGGKFSNPFVLKLKAGRSFGTRSADADPLDAWIPYRLFQNEALRLLEIVALAGAKPVELEPRLSVTGFDLAEARKIVPGDDQPIVVINPGSRDPRRRWPPKKFAVAADGLAGMGARIVINGDAGDRSAVEETLYWMRAEAQDVSGILSLPGLAGLLARSRLLLSNDSGPLHLACAVGTPVVGMYWCGNVLTYGPTRGRNTAIHISWRTNCPVCGAHCMNPGCGHRDSFVADISVDDVLASATELFYRPAADVRAEQERSHVITCD